MRKTALLLGATVAALGATPAVAQSSFMADVIGQAVMNAGLHAGLPGGNPPGCFDGRMQPKPGAIATGEQQVEDAMQLYLSTARAGYDHAAVFVDNPKMRHLSVDGAVQDVRAVWDPWAAQLARVERIGFVTSNRGTEYHAAWRAYAADGRILGIYDAYMVTWGKEGARFFDLELTSPASTHRPRQLVAFCYKPGDIEEWNTAKAKREAEKAAKRAN